jgi:hypothetical protein
MTYNIIILNEQRIVWTTTHDACALRFVNLVTQDWKSSRELKNLYPFQKFQKEDGSILSSWSLLYSLSEKHANGHDTMRVLSDLFNQ